MLLIPSCQNLISDMGMENGFCSRMGGWQKFVDRTLAWALKKKLKGRKISALSAALTQKKDLKNFAAPKNSLIRHIYIWIQTSTAWRLFLHLLQAWQQQKRSGRTSSFRLPGEENSVLDMSRFCCSQLQVVCKKKRGFWSVVAGPLAMLVILTCVTIAAEEEKQGGRGEGEEEEGSAGKKVVVVVWMAMWWVLEPVPLCALEGERGFRSWCYCGAQGL